jgi:hypothetical protein
MAMLVRAKNNSSPFWGAVQRPQRPRHGAPVAVALGLAFPGGR